ncbi:MAG: hypothetical protein ACI4OL_07135, partial [Gemmiger sp.]
MQSIPFIFRPIFGKRSGAQTCGHEPLYWRRRRRLFLIFRAEFRLVSAETLIFFDVVLEFE